MLQKNDWKRIQLNTKNKDQELIEIIKKNLKRLATNCIFTQFLRNLQHHHQNFDVQITR